MLSIACPPGKDHVSVAGPDVNAIGAPPIRSPSPLDFNTGVKPGLMAGGMGRRAAPREPQARGFSRGGSRNTASYWKSSIKHRHPCTGRGKEPRARRGSRNPPHCANISMALQIGLSPPTRGRGLKQRDRIGDRLGLLPPPTRGRGAEKHVAVGLDRGDKGDGSAGRAGAGIVGGFPTVAGHPGAVFSGQSPPPPPPRARVGPGAGVHRIAEKAPGSASQIRPVSRV